MKAVNEYLKHLGLSEIESKLYLGLLEIGSTTVMELANHVGIKRITAHFNVESLISKGLITETRKGARRQIIAEDPEKLHVLLEEQELQISQIKQSLPQIIQSIAKNIPKNSAVKNVEVRYYEGKKAVFQVYQETIRATSYYSFADLEKYYEVFPKTRDFWKEAFESNKKREVWDLLLDSPLAQTIISEKGYDRYHARILPRNSLFSGFEFADFIIYDDKVAMIQLDESSISATVIESKDMAMSLKAIHLLLWNLLPQNGKND